uniref:Protocadherin 2 alpha a 1 n=1 Tax=Nothobranchius furzeri TaxID=105023 RepID=A0A8C6K9X8_NOTFU
MEDFFLRKCWARYVLLFLLSAVTLRSTFAVTHYSLPEELEQGSVVANLASDLGLDVKTLMERKMRLEIIKYLDINKDTGELFIAERIDRELLCPLKTTTHCFLKLDATIENPIRMFNIEVEITDINDNAPHFRRGTMHLDISESSPVGERFSLNNAADPDVGANSVKDYYLSASDHFALEIQTGRDGSKFADLVLQKALDREQQAVHNLILTAVDGGVPTRTGTASIIVRVLDVNDNAPSFDKDKYVVDVMENSPIGSLVMKLNATDLDEGSNSDVVYSYSLYTSERTQEMFQLNPENGEIREPLDYEAKQVYEIKVLAADKGSVPLSALCSVTVRVEDVNDNQPEIEITSFSSHIPEDAPPGTVVALMGVTDIDSGVNGQVVCSVPADLPFDLKPSPDGQSYSLVTRNHLDKEITPMYNIAITATDLGSPALSSVKVIQVEVLDVNDNSPLFTQSPYSFYIYENNKAGRSIFSVKATDADGGENSVVSYSLDRKSPGPTAFLNINEANGSIAALKSFDFETVKSFQFQVVASDSGSPSLSSNVTVNVFILDQNDNAPVILYPVSSNGSAEGVEEVPRNVNTGHLVTKVRAYDADIGYNGWLLFSLQEVTDHSLFGLDRYTGQIRTLRSFTETDEAEHKLLILVKDNGNVSLSATATVIVKVVEPKEAFAASDVKSSAKDDEETDVTFYLMITLGSVSVLFLISIIVLIAMQCSKSTEYTSKYLQEANYDGTLCHSIQYRSGDKRYMLVGPRMSATWRESPRGACWGLWSMVEAG